MRKPEFGSLLETVSSAVEASPSQVGHHTLAPLGAALRRRLAAVGWTALTGANFDRNPPTAAKKGATSKPMIEVGS
jgi:hypothetical protein